MSAHRFFVENGPVAGDGAQSIALSSEDLHHALSVLRLKAGEWIELAEKTGGGAWGARIARIDGAGVVVDSVECLVAAPEFGVVLVQGVAKGEKMDRIVRQAVEIGVSEILPVITERTIVRLDATKRTEKGQRWRRVAKAAAEQSHRARVPLVHDPVTLSEALPSLAKYSELWALWEESGAAASGAFGAPRSGTSSTCAVVVGPEGGLSGAEVEALREVGARTASLGETILRTETAAVVAVALLTHALGGLGGRESSNT